MRGKAEVMQIMTDLNRITPAYAGKSFKSRLAFSGISDHPRLCGEKPERITGNLCGLGSPPPMRGKAKPANTAQSWEGITPAYAGKRLETASLIVRNQDHPRLCGEKFVQNRTINTEQGSPPPMRGKALLETDVYTVEGITPAYAGKSASWYDEECSKEDHPRLCGEKAERRNGEKSRLGSPPPMRGKEPEPKVKTLEIGITPAYAGKRFFGFRRTGKL